MNFDFLPSSINEIINKIPYSKICEIRLRANYPIVINIEGKNYFCNVNGITENMDKSITITPSAINYVLSKISNNSLYTINDQILKGYVSISGGIRIGVTGELVTVNGENKTIKNITSLNIRFPHEVKNCSLNCYEYIVENGIVKNTLIISPPGAGKTTFLRDIIYQISKKENINILVVDERSEISGVYDGNFNLNIGQVDVINNCSKIYGFENGIRSMNPDVIATDEINLTDDLQIIKNAITCGVKIIATIHADSINDIKEKFRLNNINATQMFERYILLSKKNKVGSLEGVYNENFGCIYL